MADTIISVGEEENDSKGAADIVDSWVSSMMKKLDPNHCKVSPFIICKVYRDIRKDDPGAYTPKIVSIGPFHRRKKNVQAMQKLKRHYLNNILTSDDGNKERRLKACLKAMKAIEPFVRSRYSVEFKMNTEEFVEMMVVDGCFLIHLLFQEQHEIKQDDPIYNNYWRPPLIRHDILLLENQFPFVVLEELCPLLGKNKDNLWKRALDFYKHLFTKEDDVERKKPKEAAVEREKPENIYHLLHLIHMFFRPAASAPPQNTPGRSSTPPNQESVQTTASCSASLSALTSRSPSPPGEQSAQELQHTLSGEQSSLGAYGRSGERQFVASGSALISSITWPPTSRGKQSLQELKRGPSSNIFSELSGSSPIYPRTKRNTRLAGSAPINPETKGRRPPGLPGKQSSEELQHTQSGQQSFEDLSVKMSMAAGSFICTSSQAYPETTHLPLPISPGEQCSQDPAAEIILLCASAEPDTRTDAFLEIKLHPPSIPQGEQSSQDPAEQDIPSGQQYTQVVTCAPPVGASGNTESKQNPPQPPKKTIPSATELQEAGLNFQLKKANNFLDVTFNQGKLEMPCLGINDSTNSLFRNFIAFEQCFPYWGSHFTSYCFFMDSLVNTAKDVGILSRKDVIENLLGSDEDVALLFNKLCKGVFINFDDSYLAEVFKNINIHTKETWWPKQRAKLMHDYFSNPWSMLSVAAASLIIILTLVQTFFTAFAYFRPPKS